MSATDRSSDALSEVMADVVKLGRYGSDAERAEPMTVTSRQDERLRSVATAGRHQFTIDEPRGFGGTDLGPNPAEIMMAGICASVEVTARMHALHLGLDLDTVSTSCSGALDVAGFAGEATSGSAGFPELAITVDLTFAVEPDAAAIETLQHRIRSCCPVLATVENPTRIKMAVRPVLTGT